MSDGVCKQCHGLRPVHQVWCTVGDPAGANVVEAKAIYDRAMEEFKVAERKMLDAWHRWRELQESEKWAGSEIPALPSGEGLP